MFSGEESIRIRSNLPEEELENIIADTLDRMGNVKFRRDSGLRVLTRKYYSAFSSTAIEGELVRDRKPGHWTLSLYYQVQPSALCWVIAILGLIFFLIGPLILLVPYSSKGQIQRDITRAIRDARDDVEDEEEAKRTAPPNGATKPTP